MAGLIMATAAIAQEEFVPDKGQTPAKEEPKKDDPEKELKDKIKKYDDIIKDAEKSEGYFTFYKKIKDGKTDVYLELQPGQLGKYWFLEATLRTGANSMGLQAGEPVNPSFQKTDAFRFERKGDNIWLFVPNLSWRWEPGSDLAIAAKRSFPEGVIDDFKIEAEHPESKKMLLKMTEFFYGNVFELNQRINMVLGRPYQLDRNKSAVSEIKALPENTVIRADLYYNSPSGASSNSMQAMLEMLGLGGKSHLADGRSLPLSVTYLIYPQRESDYTPRLYDWRVGYFTEDFFDHAKALDIERTTRYINRWNLKKKDPGAKMSEPVKPIVWYIDDSVPEKWREACAEGIRRWNKAFEQLGYKDAVVVKMKPKDADWDHADMRYNVLRFINSENAGYAVAWFRTDPFTGEIVNAGISVDMNMVMYVGQEYTWLTNPARETWTKSLGLMSAPSERATATTNAFRNWNKVDCKLGEGKLRSATFGWNALESIIPNGTSINRDEYVREFLADVISHEMGHCLGLRHNFVASTFLTDEQLADPKITAETGTTASVMDYTPVNMAAVAKGKGHYFTRTVGHYDMFAIEYGYADVAGDSALAQRPALLNIAKKGSMPGNLFMTDENADTFDPYVVRFDNSRDPIANATLSISVAKKLLATADKKYPKPGRPYSDLTRVVNMALRTTFGECMTAARFVGGVAGRRNMAGDPNEGPTLAPVDPAMQRAAIQMIAREILSEDSFKLSEKILLNLSGDFSQDDYSDAPIKDLISSMQAAAIANLLSADTTARVANNAFKLNGRADKFTLAELYSTIVGKVFSEVGTGRTIGVLRRDLQRFTIEGLTMQALARPGQVQEDVRMLAWDNLRRLSARLAQAKSADDMTAMHMRDLKSRIDRALKSVVTSGR